MEEITTVGIDLAKEVFAICILDERGAVRERKVMRRAAFERWAAALPACTVAMQACGSAHHWGRTFAARGHSVRLIAAEFVAAFRQGGENDGNDALAIAIAARQPTIRFVPIKTVEQQAILSWHRARAGFVVERTALINRLRGLLAEFGIMIGRSSDRCSRRWRRLPMTSACRCRCAGCCWKPARSSKRWPRASNAATPRSPRMPALTPPRSAPVKCSVSVCSPPAPSSPRCRTRPCSVMAANSAPGWGSRRGRPAPAARHAWAIAAGAVMRTCVRTLLIQGARSALQAALKTPPDKASPLQRWIAALYGRRGHYKTLVAIANKHTRPVGDALARCPLRSARRTSAAPGTGANHDARRGLRKVHRCACASLTEVRPNVGTPRLTRWPALGWPRPISAPPHGRERIGILRATPMVARVRHHDADEDTTRPVAELQSASR
jgi:hypothetical protein